ncbi:MAG: hypothetical protein ACRDDY_13220 [Clostridium sp.]
MEKKHKTMRLPIDLIEKIEKMAEKEHRTFTNMIEFLLMEATREAVSE